MKLWMLAIGAIALLFIAKNKVAQSGGVRNMPPFQPPANPRNMPGGLGRGNHLL